MIGETKTFLDVHVKHGDGSGKRGMKLYFGVNRKYNFSSFCFFFPKTTEISYLAHHTFWLDSYHPRFYKDLDLEMGIPTGGLE